MFGYYTIHFKVTSNQLEDGGGLEPIISIVKKVKMSTLKKLYLISIIQNKYLNCLTHYFLGCMPYGTQQFLEPFLSKHTILERKK